MTKTYQYVGPHELLKLESSPTRQRILSVSDVLSWWQSNQHEKDNHNEIVATFVVDAEGELWIADRQSEHVACAGTKPVLSAGEMTFQSEKGSVKVLAISNQSTGYCPEPETWPLVAKVLDEIGFVHPADFSPKFVFRFCFNCQSINIVKDDWFVCDLCDSALSVTWNFDGCFNS